MRFVTLNSTLLMIGSAAGCTDETGAPAPSIERIAPVALCTQGSIYVTLLGEGFVTGSRVRFVDGGGDATQWLPAIGNATSLVASYSDGQPVSDRPPDVYDVEVELPDGQLASLPDALTSYGDIWYSAVSPSHAPGGSSVTITLTGGGFRDRVSVELGVQAARTTLVENLTSATSLRFDLDLTGVAPGAYPLVVRNPGGCEFARDFAFTVE